MWPFSYFSYAFKRISSRFSQSENENLERTRQKSAATNQLKKKHKTKKNSTKKIYKENFQLKNFYYILLFCTIQNEKKNEHLHTSRQHPVKTIFSLLPIYPPQPSQFLLL